MRNSIEKLSTLMRIIRIIYLIVMVCSGITGVVYNVTQTQNGVGVFAYYTIQSNILCISAGVFYIVLIIKNSKVSEDMMSIVQGGIVMCIMLTFLVFHFLLLPTIDPTSDLLGPGNTFIHYILPLMVLGDYVIFQKKGLQKISYIVFWTLIPLAYCAFVYIYSGFGGRFGVENHYVPYFFLDYKRFGYGGTFLWILGLALGYIMLSGFYILVDKILYLIIKSICKKGLKA